MRSCLLTSSAQFLKSGRFFSILLVMLWERDKGCLEVCVILSGNPLSMRQLSEEIIALIISSSEISISIMNALPSSLTMMFFASFIQAFPSVLTLLSG